MKKAVIDFIDASYIKEITKYTENVIIFANTIKSRLSFPGDAGKKYWKGLKVKIDARSNLTNVWGTTQIKAETDQYLADYSQIAVNPMVSSLKAIARTVAKNTTANLMTCYVKYINSYIPCSLPSLTR